MFKAEGPIDEAQRERFRQTARYKKNLGEKRFEIRLGQIEGL